MRSEVCLRIQVSPIPFLFKWGGLQSVSGDPEEFLEYAEGAWQYKNSAYQLVEASKWPFWCLKLQPIHARAAVINGHSPAIMLFPVTKTSQSSQWQMALLERFIKSYCP